ncbi:MAG TPA: DUF1552 domain-containing protein [Cellvibrio sp.]|nr:DUF1552 domain-containing protein [Cellvibrio sp.]
MRYKDCFDKERRDFLRVVKHAGVSAGLLRASSLIGGVMLARVAEAQSGPNKSCLIFSGGGCHPKFWFPTGNTFPVQSAPLQSHYSKMTMLKNATLAPGAGHGGMFAKFDNASWGRDSFEVNMGRTIGANFPVKYLNVANVPISNLTREGPREIPSISSPQTVLDILFSGGTTPSTGVAPRKSAVDLHYAAVNSMKNKLGQHEKIKLDNHFTAIREIETAIGTGSTSGGSSGSCPKPSATSGITGFDALAKVHSDLIVLALNCNLTASVSIAFGDDTHNHAFDKLGGRLSHQSHHFNQTMFDEDINYMQGLTKYLLDKLDAAGLLNSTIVTQLSDMGDPDQHSNVDVPMIVVGGGITGNRVLEVGKASQASLFQTLGLKLKADQSPGGTAYRNWEVPVIAGL